MTALANPVITRRARFRLARTPHKIVLTTHVLTSVGWFGVALTVAFGGVAAATTNDSRLAHAVYQMIEMVPWLSIPLGLLAVASGTLLGLGTKWGLVRHWWVVAKIAIAVAVIVTDAVLIRRVAHDAAVNGNPIYGPIIAHVVVLAIATVLSVFKPRGRVNARSRSRSRG
jgi:hypothetical protein